MNQDRRRRDAVLIALYVLGTLLLFLLTRRAERREALAWSERREGELRDALADAAAPAFDDGAEFTGVSDQDAAHIFPDGGWEREDPLRSMERRDGLRSVAPEGRWDFPRSRSCR